MTTNHQTPLPHFVSIIGERKDYNVPLPSTETLQGSKDLILDHFSFIKKLNNNTSPFLITRVKSTIKPDKELADIISERTRPLIFAEIIEEISNLCWELKKVSSDTCKIELTEYVLMGISIKFETRFKLEDEI